MKVKYIGENFGALSLTNDKTYECVAYEDGSIKNVDCPMMCKSLDLDYCIELQMIVNNEINPTEEEKHLSILDYEKCKKCKIRKILEQE